MAADALAPFVVRSSAVMILIKQIRRIHVFHKKGVKLPVLSQCAEMMENGNMTYIIFYISFKIFYKKGG